MHIHTRPEASSVRLHNHVLSWSSRLHRWPLIALGIGGLALLASCGETATGNEQLGSAPVTSNVEANVDETTDQLDTAALDTFGQPVDQDAVGQDTVDQDSVDQGADDQGSDDEDTDVADKSDTPTISSDAVKNGGQDDTTGSTSTSQARAADLDEPAKAIEKVSTELKADAGSADDGAESLDAVEPLDHKAGVDETQDLREGSRLNESGEQNVFDEAANLACADVEVALTALDEGRLANAADRIDSAADRAGSSRVIAIDQWHPILQDTAKKITHEESGEIAPLLAFLSTCTQGGYEL